jgi:hypothetical protein
MSYKPSTSAPHAGKSSASKQQETTPSPLESPASSAHLSFENLVPSPESQADPGHSEDPELPLPRVPGPSACSRAQGPPLVETVDESQEAEEEEEDARSDSERDGDLTDASSAGESIAGNT